MMRDTAPVTLTAPNLTAPHAFTTRLGGVSVGPYAASQGGGLNLDERAMNGMQDHPDAVSENRRLLTARLGFQVDQVALLDQIHSADVLEARPGLVGRGDALVTDRPGVLLAIMTADCYPVLLHDPVAGVVGAAHAGWRGALARVAARTLERMCVLGADPSRVQAAVGPGICGAHYEVGEDVAGQFVRAGLGASLKGRRLDLARANVQALTEAGVPETQVWVSGRCTTEPDFYSYRRDNGVTGRMWAVIGLAPDATPHVSHGAALMDGDTLQDSLKRTDHTRNGGRA